MLTSLLLSGTACNRLGPIVASDTLAKDTQTLPRGDLGAPGPQPVTAERITIDAADQALPVALYAPVGWRPNAPAVVFLPGRMAPDDQYESYGRALASRGIIVAMHGWYSPFMTDIELAERARLMADWLVQTYRVNAARIGIAGHSMGGKDAVLAAAGSDRFASVVAIDPDDNGRISAVDGPVGTLRVPLLLIGAEVAWQAASVCAPQQTNYQRFFERAPPGTIELTLRHADHVQMLDEPDRFGYGICRCGTADSREVRIISRRATVGFFVQHLQDGPALPRPSSRHAVLRVAQPVQIAAK